MTMLEILNIKHTTEIFARSSTGWQKLPPT